jgi:tRNA(Ile)-lysidine synthase
MKSRRNQAFASLADTLRDFPLTSRYLIGASGGRDSVALLHLLLERGYRNLVVCHLDHQLRGRSSAADARFVGQLAARSDLHFELESTNVRALAAKKKLSIETAARVARYEFFARIAKRKRCRTIFLAHHADDLVETFLINLFRGAGTTGLAGMREISTRCIDDVELTIVRPLLSAWRSDIDRHVKHHRLKFREDVSNRDLSPLRNRIRHRVIPYLEKTLGRNIRPGIWRAATIAAEEESFFDELLAPNLRESRRPKLDGLKPSSFGALDTKELRLMPLALQRRTLRDWLRAHKISEVNFAVVERVRALVELTNRVAKTNLPGNRHARRRAGKIFIE